MASFNLRNFGPCLSQFREIQLFSRNLTDFVNYDKPPKHKYMDVPLTLFESLLLLDK